MGYYFDQLVPAAILYDNPGITAEEFGSRLDRVLIHTDGLVGSIFRGRGLRGLAETLKLDYNRDAESLTEVIGTDFYGYDVPKWELRGTSQEEQFPALVSYGQRNRGEGVMSVLEYDPSIDWRENVGDRQNINDFENPEYIKIDGVTYSFFDIDHDDFIQGVFSPDGKDLFGKIKSVVLKKDVCLHEDEGEAFSEVFYNYNIVMDLIEVFVEREEFRTEEDLYRAYPEFHPRKVWDFSKESGDFYVGVDISGADVFRWVQKDGRYFLDVDYMERNVGKGFSSRDNYGITDLVVTAEAIRTKSFDVLARCGLLNLGEMFKRNPESLKRRNRAVWDSETSLNAKKRGLTNFELMRMRLLTGRID